MKKVFALLFLSIIVLASCGGGGGGGSNNAATLVSISVLPKDNVIAAGTTRQFTATGTFSNNLTTDLTTIVAWKSSNTSVANINSSGMVTTGAAGTSTITATYGVITGTTTLTVPSNPLVSIAVTPAITSIAPGTSRQFTATGTYQNGSTQDLTASATWSSSSPAVATIIPATGRVTAVSAGTTTITATMSAIPGSTTLTVATLDSIVITPVNPTLTAGTSQQFTATGTLSNTATQDLTTFVAWSSSSPSIATIDPASGKATAVSVVGGTTTITATLGAISGTTVLSVPVPPPTVDSIAIAPVNPTISNGTIQQFTATGTLSDATTQNLTTSVAWSSSNPSVATIDPASGKATAVGVGTSTITADLGGGKSGTTLLTVIPFNVAGTWTGTYTIYDSLDPGQIGTYTFEFILAQSGASVTGTATLRGNIPSQTVTGQLTGTVTGRQMNVTFTYISRENSKLLTDIGTANITGGAMTGSFIENYQDLYNCSYTFALTKL